MSIEQAGPPVSPKASAPQDKRGVKGGADAAGEAPEGGFATLLTAISPSVDPPATEVSNVAQLPAAKEDLKEDESLLVVAPPIGLVNFSNLIPDAADASVSEGSIALDVAAIAPGGLPDPSSPSGLQTPKSTVPVIDKVVVSPAELAQGDKNLVPTAVGASVDLQVQKLVQARRTVGEELKADASNVRLEARALKAASDLELGGKDAIQSKLSLASEFATRLLEPVERPRGKLFGSLGGSVADSGWTPYAHHARPVGDMPSNFNAMATVQTQTQVADKVSYWLTQGVQNAELKLDGFGADPVEVSILLKGGEAHVGFRSDQPEVRQMLEGALSQLKDAMEREGVLLSGVTVGGSGADGGRSQQEQRQGSSANRGGGVDQASSEPRVIRASTSVGRSLDIFV